MYQTTTITWARANVALTFGMCINPLKGNNMNIDWAQKFIDSDLMDQILAYKLQESIKLNSAAIAELKDRQDLEDFEKEDLEDCYSWHNSLVDVYTYFGGHITDVAGDRS